MSLRRKLTIAGLILGITTFGAEAFAQQMNRNVTDAVQPGARKAGQRRLPPILRLLRQLDLTDAQKQQARTIFQATLQSTKAQRQELGQLTRQWRQGTLTPAGLARANELRKELAAARKGMHDQLLAILTPEQKAKLEELIKARGRRNLMGLDRLPN